MLEISHGKSFAILPDVGKLWFALNQDRNWIGTWEGEVLANLMIVPDG